MAGVWLWKSYNWSLNCFLCSDHVDWSKRVITRICHIIKYSYVGTGRMKIFYIKWHVCCEAKGIFNAKNAKYCTFTPCKLQEEHVIYFRSRFKKNITHPSSYKLNGPSLTWAFLRSQNAVKYKCREVRDVILIRLVIWFPTNYGFPM
jgi:hypothetical protein